MFDYYWIYTRNKRGGLFILKYQSEIWQLKESCKRLYNFEIKKVLI